MNAINLAIVNGWDHFDMALYYRYLKTLNHVESTLPRIHRQTLEDIIQERRSRYKRGSSQDEQPVGEVNN